MRKRLIYGVFAHFCCFWMCILRGEHPYGWGVGVWGRHTFRQGTLPEGPLMMRRGVTLHLQYALCGHPTHFLLAQVGLYVLLIYQSLQPAP